MPHTDAYYVLLVVLAYILLNYAIHAAPLMPVPKACFALSCAIGCLTAIACRMMRRS